MNNRNVILFLSFLFVNGCAVASDSTVRKDATGSVDSKEMVRNDPQKLPISYALQGTKTAVVGIAINKEGYPLETVQAIVLKPGQKVIFAGPDEFQVSFKNKKAPAAQFEYRSEKGVITVEIPKDLLERPEYKREFARNKSVEFNYAILINGRELDPPLIVKKED